MLRTCLALATLSGGLAWGAAPTYSAAGLVNGANFTASAAAPNSLVTLFGTDLAWTTEILTTAHIANGSLPFNLAEVRVSVGNYWAPLFYVSPTQINFLVPANLRTGAVTLRVVRQGVVGPELSMTLVDAAPQFFSSVDGYVIAQHSDYSLITPDSPARPGEVIVIYAIGLGRTAPQPAAGEIPWYPGWMTQLESLRVSIDGVVLGPEHIWYAGLSPGWAGLYQINLILPDPLPPNPELRAAVGDQPSAAGLKLATAPNQPQPFGPGKR